MKKFIFSVLLLSAVWVQASDNQQHQRRQLTPGELRDLAQNYNVPEVMQYDDGSLKAKCRFCNDWCIEIGRVTENGEVERAPRRVMRAVRMIIGLELRVTPETLPNFLSVLELLNRSNQQ